MGYSYYKQIWNGVERDAGYSVEAECDFPGCHKMIDRGMAYMCCDTNSNQDRGCRGFFCEEHRPCVLCLTCLEELEKEEKK